MPGRPQFSISSIERQFKHKSKIVGATSGTWCPFSGSADDGQLIVHYKVRTIMDAKFQPMQALNPDVNTLRDRQRN